MNNLSLEMTPTDDDRWVAELKIDGEVTYVFKSHNYEDILRAIATHFNSYTGH